jgi:magnesium-transporting ATPase (P-type)
LEGKAVIAGISVTCFLLSYLVVLLMEASRVFLKVPGRNLILVGMLIAGLLAHTLFLLNQFSSLDQLGGEPQLLSNWFQWMIVIAWGLAVACLILTIRNPNGSMGLFLIPTVLALIGLAQLVRDLQPFQPETTINLWRAIHGVSLLVGTMFISFGLAFGVMYLVQSSRLKSKKRATSKFKLPTLEFLQSMNRLSLFASAIGLALGLISGVILNFNREGQIAWFSGGIVFTCALFVWALMAALLEFTSAGSLGGRRSAYLVIANFVFLALVLTLVLVSSHGQPASAEQPAARGSQTSWEASV